MIIKLTAICLMLISCVSGQSNMEPFWDEQAPGVWHIQFGKQQKIDLLKASGSQSRWKTLNQADKAAFPLDKEKIDCKIVAGKTYLRFPLERGEQIFGLGLHFKTTNQRGRILNLHMDHYGGQDNGRTHVPVPFYVSSKGYGVFINSAEYLTVYVGTGVRKNADDQPVMYNRNEDKKWNPNPYSDAVEILIPADGAEVYILGGPDPLNAVQRFNLLTGGGVLPPKWGLGFTHRVPTLYSDLDVIREVEQFELRDFPLDFVGLEPGWQSQAYPCTFDWDQTRYPDPKRFIEKMREKGVGVNLWLNPYISPSSSMFNKMKSYTASHTVWNGWIPDYTMSEARIIFQKHIKEKLLDIGVEGFKIDEVDGFDSWLWPDVSIFPSGYTAEQMRQIYGLLLQDVITEVYKKKNKRTYGLVRASNAGGSGLPFVIYNDYYSHQDFITALCNSSFIGTLWTPEVRASKSAEEWLRRMQSVCLSPLAMINAWADGTKPWSFPEVEDEIREVSYMRMRILPYLYTTFAQYYFEGTPPVRSMNLLWNPSEKDTTDWQQAIYKGVNDQFMVGDYLLVAPVFAGEKSRVVIFPEGKWYDFYTGKLAGEAEVKEINAPLNQIPLFVKNGGLIPMMPKMRHIPRNGEKYQLTIRHYGEMTGLYNLYDDDGLTFNYEEGDYHWRRIEVTNYEDKWVGKIDQPDPEKPNSYQDVKWLFMGK